MAKRKQGPGTPVGESSPVGDVSPTSQDSPTPTMKVLKSRWPGVRSRSEAEDAHALWRLSLDAGVGARLARKDGLPRDGIAGLLVRIARVRRQPDFFRGRGDDAYLLRVVALVAFAARPKPRRRSAGLALGQPSKR